MKRIFLDSYPAGLLCSPITTPPVAAITQWATSHIASGNRLYVPEIIDYELRRELIRSGKTNSVIELNLLKYRFIYLPLSTLAMQTAAELWAQSRNQGTPTGDPKKLDVDVILAAQVLTETSNVSGMDVVVATSNVKHLSRFVTADLWENILP